MGNEHNEIYLQASRCSKTEGDLDSTEDSNLTPDEERITKPLSSPRIEVGEEPPAIHHTGSLYQLACSHCDGHLVGLKASALNNPN